MKIQPSHRLSSHDSASPPAEKARPADAPLLRRSTALAMALMCCLCSCSSMSQQTGEILGGVVGAGVGGGMMALGTNGMSGSRRSVAILAGAAGGAGAGATFGRANADKDIRKTEVGPVTEGH